MSLRRPDDLLKPSSRTLLHIDPGGNKMRRAAAALLAGLVLLALGPGTPRAEDKGEEPCPPLDFDKTIVSRLYEALHNGIKTHVIWAGSPHHKNVALTFDDGPNAKYTPLVLKVLEGHKVRATFFLIGREASRRPELVREVHLAGHEIGNHTYSHVRLPEIPSNAIRRELESTRDILREVTGRETILLRPPWGFLDSRSLAEIALRRFATVLWSVDSRDWSRPGARVIVHNVLSKVQPGSIILCHDDHEQIVEALPEIIEGLKEQGYQFITVSEMIALSM